MTKEKELPLSKKERKQLANQVDRQLQEGRLPRYTDNMRGFHCESVAEKLALQNFLFRAIKHGLDDPRVARELKLRISQNVLDNLGKPMPDIEKRERYAEVVEGRYSGHVIYSDDINLYLGRQMQVSSDMERRQYADTTRLLLDNAGTRFVDELEALTDLVLVNLAEEEVNQLKSAGWEDRVDLEFMCGWLRQHPLRGLDKFGPGLETDEMVTVKMYMKACDSIAQARSAKKKGKRRGKHVETGPLDLTPFGLDLELYQFPTYTQWMLFDVMSHKGKMEAVERMRRIEDSKIDEKVSESNIPILLYRAHNCDMRRQMMGYAVQGAEEYMNALRRLEVPPMGPAIFSDFGFTRQQLEIVEDTVRRLPNTPEKTKKELGTVFAFALARMKSDEEPDARMTFIDSVRQVLDNIESGKERKKYLTGLERLIYHQSSFNLVRDVVEEIDSLSHQEKRKLRLDVLARFNAKSDDPAKETELLNRTLGHCEKIDPLGALATVPMYMLAGEMYRSYLRDGEIWEHIDPLMEVAVNHAAIQEGIRTVDEAKYDDLDAALKKFNDAAVMSVGDFSLMVQGIDPKEAAAKAGGESVTVSIEYPGQQIREWVDRVAEGGEDSREISESRRALARMADRQARELYYMEGFSNATMKMLADNGPQTAADYWSMFSFPPAEFTWDGACSRDSDLLDRLPDVTSPWVRQAFVEDLKKMNAVKDMCDEAGVGIPVELPLAMCKSEQHLRMVTESGFIEAVGSDPWSRIESIAAFTRHLEGDRLSKARATVCAMGIPELSKRRHAQSLINSRNISDEEVGEIEWERIEQEPASIIGQLDDLRSNKHARKMADEHYRQALGRHKLRDTPFAELASSDDEIRSALSVQRFAAITEGIPVELQGVLVNVLDSVPKGSDPALAAKVLASGSLEAGMSELRDTPYAMGRYLHGLSESAGSYTPATIDEVNAQALTQEVRSIHELESSMDWSDTTGEQRTRVMDMVVAQSPEMRQVLATRPAAELAQRIGDQKYMESLRAFIKDSGWIDELPNQG